MKTAIQHLKISSAGFHNFAFFLLTFYFPNWPINQFESIMQNKPNLPNALMNVTSFYTVDYENKRLRRCVKTNPIQTQYEPNTNPIPEMPKMNENLFATKVYENITTFGLRQNKPNTNPIYPYRRGSKPNGGGGIMSPEMTIGKGATRPIQNQHNTLQDR